jgi:predicted RNase H-like HicB family nuclease
MSTNYRVLVQFDGEKSVFVARAPELEHCVAEGATRAEAIAKLEEEITATLANVKEQGGRAPAALDDSAEINGELAAKVSRSLHRELLWQARNEGIELSQLVGELLSASLSDRRRTGGPRRQGEDRNGNNRDAGPPRRGPGGGRNDPRYHNIMEDRGSFMEYVRSLEQSGGRPPGGGGGGGGGPRRGGPPHRGGGGGGRGPGGGGRGQGGGQGGPPSGSGGPGGPGSDDDGGVP